MEISATRIVRFCRSTAFASVLVLLIPASLSSGDYAPGFGLAVRQYGKDVKIEKNEAVLSRDAFDLVFSFEGKFDLLVNVWDSPESFDQAAADAPLENITGFTHTGMAEGHSNADREIFPRRDAPHCWYFVSDKDNRFNGVERKGGRIHVTRTVEKVYLEDETTLRLKDYRAGALYFVFARYEYDTEFSKKKLLAMKILKIKFK